MWEVIIPAIASLAGGYLSGQGAQKAGEAQASAANASAALQKDIYYDQRGLARPGYLTGGSAANKLAAMYGIAPQDYAAAYGGGGYSGGGQSSGMLPNYGAGQAVQGHSGGGGSNALAAAAGAIAGSFLPIPGGAQIGAALGGLIRNGGDDWKTVATQAPGGFDYNAYMQQPDLASEWAKPDIKALFGGNQDAYANWHYNQFGKGEGRTLNSMTDTKGTMPTGGADQVGGGQAYADPMAEFLGSMENRLATEASDIDFGKIKGQLGASGKSISGAAEGRYAKTLAGNRMGAFGDYKNSLRSLAGMGTDAGSQVSSAAGQYGVNAGNTMMAAGQARGNALAGKYAGYAQGLSGASGVAADYFKSPGTPTYGKPGYVDQARAAYPGQY